MFSLSFNSFFFLLDSARPAIQFFRWLLVLRRTNVRNAHRLLAIPRRRRRTTLRGHPEIRRAVPEHHQRTVHFVHPLSARTRSGQAAGHEDVPVRRNTQACLLLQNRLGQTRESPDRASIQAQGQVAQRRVQLRSGLYVRAASTLTNRRQTPQDHRRGDLQRL